MNLVRYCRLRAGLTQTELAKRANISQPALARIESGRISPRIDTIETLLRECGMSLQALPRAGTGVDRSTIRKMLSLAPRERLRLAAREATNLEIIRPRRRP